MSKIVDNYARDIAVDRSIEILKHQSNRVYDAMTDLDRMLGRAQDPEKVLKSIQELFALLGGMRQCVLVWQKMRADLLKHQDEKPEPTSIGDNATAPECTCALESSEHGPDCPRGKWISDTWPKAAPVEAPTAETPAPKSSVVDFPF